MTAENTVGRNAFANMVQVLASTGLLFALYRYINATLGVAQLGVWAVVLATATASKLANLGLGAGMTRFVSRYRALGEPKMAAHMVETAFSSLLVFLTIVLPVLYFPLNALMPHIFDGQRLSEAQSLLPYALLAFWLSELASVFQSALDGLQRMDLRAGIMVLGQGVRFVLAVALIPMHGLLGLAEAQVAQGVFYLLATWSILRPRLRGLSWVPFGWSRKAFREMIGYGANVQIAGLFMMMADPVAKAFMAKFGGASAAGFFEMANQVVMKARSLVVMANAAVVPRIAELNETAPARITHYYIYSQRILIFVALPAMAIIVSWSGPLSWALSGSYRVEFVRLVLLLSLAWGVNTLAGPAYFSNLGTGRVGWNTVSHVVIGIINAGLGWFLGSGFGANGVLFAYCAALICGSALLMTILQSQYGIRWRNLLSREHLILAAVCFAVVLLGWTRPFRPGVDAASTLALGLTLEGTAIILAMWAHPLRRDLWRQFVSRRSEG